MKTSFLKLTFLGLLFAYNLFAQVPAPQYETFKPLVDPNYNLYQRTTDPRTESYNRMAREDLERKQQEELRRRFLNEHKSAIDYIKVKITIEDIKQLGNPRLSDEENRQLLAEMFYELNQDKIDNLIKQQLEAKNNPYYKKPEFIEATKEYNEAYLILQKMLEGQIPLSIKDAVYVVENAYLQGNQKISYSDYNKKIKELAKFCRIYLSQEGFNSKDNLAVNMVIQAFMSDTLTIIDPFTKKKVVHNPFYYDFDNYDPDNNFGNYLFTKVLLKGAGQCHSLPIMYLILAEELGGTAYWSFASMHSFIKFKDNRGTLFNYETTRGFISSDAYTMMSHFINAKAEKNKIYLDTANPKQAVAYCLVDLARGYEERFDYADGIFMENCCRLSLQYFPNCIEAYLLLGTVYQNRLKNIMDDNGVRSVFQILHIPAAKENYAKFQETNKKIESLGYQEVPKELYEYWVKSIADEATMKKDLQNKAFLKKQLTRVAKSN